MSLDNERASVKGSSTVQPVEGYNVLNVGNCHGTIKRRRRGRTSRHDLAGRDVGASKLAVTGSLVVLNRKSEGSGWVRYVHVEERRGSKEWLKPKRESRWPVTVCRSRQEKQDDRTSKSVCRLGMSRGVRMMWPTAKIRRHNQAVRDSQSTAQLDRFDVSDTSQ